MKSNSYSILMAEGKKLLGAITLEQSTRLPPEFFMQLWPVWIELQRFALQHHEEMSRSEQTDIKNYLNTIGQILRDSFSLAQSREMKRAIHE